jgi:DegV family protein with EDD domain
MQKVAIVTDGSSDLPKDLVEEYNIHIAPFQVVFGTEAYQMMGNYGDLGVDEFYEKLRTCEDYPTTAVPSPKSFVTAFQNAAKEADKIIGIFISKELSGTYQSAARIVPMIEGAEVTLIDSKVATSTLGCLVIEAAKMAKNGADHDEIVTRINELIPKAQLVSINDSVDAVYRSGRVGWAKKFLVDAFKIKPIIRFEEGKIVPGGTVRGREKVDEVMKFAAPYIVKNAITDLIFVWHTRNRKQAEEIKEIMEANNPDGKEIRIIEAGPVIGTHVGENAIAFMYIGEYNKNWLLKMSDEK